MVRLFLAINLPDQVRDRLAGALAPLRTAAPHLSWVDTPRLHLTLKFLGEQPDTAAPALSVALDVAAARHAPLSLTLGGLGAFPNLRRPRVVWMDVSAEPRLELLHHDVELACEGLGFEVDGRAFRPHLTLGRVRDTVPLAEVRALANAAKSVNFRETVTVETVDLMHSQLSPRGSRYAVLHAAPLRRT